MIAVDRRALLGLLLLSLTPAEAWAVIEYLANDADTGLSAKKATDIDRPNKGDNHGDNSKPDRTRTRSSDAIEPRLRERERHATKSPSKEYSGTDKNGRRRDGRERETERTHRATSDRVKAKSPTTENDSTKEHNRTTKSLTHQSGARLARKDLGKASLLILGTRVALHQMGFVGRAASIGAKYSGPMRIAKHAVGILANYQELEQAGLKEGLIGGAINGELRQSYVEPLRDAIGFTMETVGRGERALSREFNRAIAEPLGRSVVAPMERAIQNAYRREYGNFGL